MFDVLNKVIDNVKKEISVASFVNGLCYYASNNIVYDLDKALINSEMFNISEISDTNYNHWFVLARLDCETYLIDTTYFQFARKNEDLRFFEKWPSEILEKRNKKLLKNLLIDGYSKVNDEDFYDYLSGFNENFRPMFTLDDLMDISFKKDGAYESKI